MSKPNILIVMSDQQRADLRKGWGYLLDTMPFLDQFASEGVDFGRAYTPNPTCMPARVSMFTGRYPSAHQVRTNHNAKDALYTQDLLDILKSVGYRTAICGKNHTHRKPEDFDFHETCGHLGYEDEMNKTPEEIAFTGFLRATHNMETHVPSPGGIEAQNPFRIVSSTFRFIDACPEDQPFFAWVSFPEPHNPSQVPEPYFDMFPPESLPPAHFGTEVLADKGPRWTWLRGIWEKVMGDEVESRMLRADSNYHGMLRLIDDQFKRLIQGLEARGLRENTFIIYLSDHGDIVGEYGLIRKGIDLPEVLTHVPMIIQGPGIAPCGLRNNVCVNIVDILPTLCDLIGVKTPLGVQGKSLLPLLRGEAVPEGEFATALSESGYSGLYWDDEDELTLDAVVANLDRVLGFVDARLESLDCPIRTQMQIDVAVEELFVNIASYAYGPEGGTATILLESYDDPKRISITFIDSGWAYDPLQRPDPDLTLPAEKREIGGLGIYMVKKSMDDVRYERRGDENVLTITKNL